MVAHANACTRQSAPKGTWIAQCLTGSWHLWLFFARVEPPFMQEVHMSACAAFGRVSWVERGQNNTKQTPKNNTKTTQPTKHRAGDSWKCSWMHMHGWDKEWNRGRAARLAIRDAVRNACWHIMTLGQGACSSRLCHRAPEPLLSAVRSSALAQVTRVNTCPWSHTGPAPLWEALMLSQMMLAQASMPNLPPLPPPSRGVPEGCFSSSGLECLKLSSEVNFLGPPACENCKRLAFSSGQAVLGAPRRGASPPSCGGLQGRCASD